MAITPLIPEEKNAPIFFFKKHYFPFGWAYLLVTALTISEEKAALSKLCSSEFFFKKHIFHVSSAFFMAITLLISEEKAARSKHYGSEFFL